MTYIRFETQIDGKWYWTTIDADMFDPNLGERKKEHLEMVSQEGKSEKGRGVAYFFGAIQTPNSIVIASRWAIHKKELLIAKETIIASYPLPEVEMATQYDFGKVNAVLRFERAEPKVFTFNREHHRHPWKPQETSYESQIEIPCEKRLGMRLMEATVSNGPASLSSLLLAPVIEEVRKEDGGCRFDGNRGVILWTTEYRTDIASVYRQINKISADIGVKEYYVNIETKKGHGILETSLKSKIVLPRGIVGLVEGD